MNLLKSLNLSVIIMLLSMLNACGFNPCLQKEIFRLTSQDNIVDVVIIQKDCGATTSINNSVYIVPKGELIKKQQPVFISDHVSDLKVEWIKPKFLVISYVEARIFNFTNFWHNKNIDNFMYEVSINEEKRSSSGDIQKDRVKP